jgi:cytochrome P450 family 135
MALHHRRIPAELEHLPSSRHPALLNAFDYWLRVNRFTERLGALGDRFVVTMPGSGAWLGLTHPDDIGAVFRAKSEAVNFAEALRMLSPHELVLGPAALTSLDGSQHAAMRRALMPLFTGPALRGYEPMIDAKARELLGLCPTDVPTQARKYAQLVTLEIIMAVIFGVSDRDRLDRLRAAIIELTDEIGSGRFLLQIAISNARNDRFRRPFPRIEARKAAIDAIVLEEVADREQSGITRDDVLGRLLAARSEAADHLDDAELCDQLRLLLLGGHDTTATTIAWVLERVTHNPAVLTEVERTVRGGDDSYLDAVIHETLRLRPVSPITVRLTKEPLALDGLTVPPDTLVVPFIAVVHRRPDIYPDPHVFLPERFLGSRPHPFSWIPFGGGMRRCIGAPMAMLEARIVLSALFRGFDIRAARPTPEAITRSSIFTVPKRGAEIIARPRMTAAIG